MVKVMCFLGSRNKALLAAVAALLAWGQLIVDSPRTDISSHEWLTLGILMAGVLGVERVTNKS